jgi:hypothetical protein
MFKGLSQMYGWTPQQIAALTLPQVDAYLAKDGGVSKTRTMTLPEFRAWQASLRK